MLPPKGQCAMISVPSKRIKLRRVRGGAVAYYASNPDMTFKTVVGQVSIKYVTNALPARRDTIIDGDTQFC